MPDRDAGPLRVSEPAAAYAIDLPAIPFPPPAATGRPSKFTPDVCTRVIAAIRAGNYYEPACVANGVSYNTFREWMLAGDAGEPGFYEFSVLVKAAESEAELELQGTIRNAVPVNPRVGIELLARRHPERWADQSRLTVDHTGTVTSSIEITVLTSNDLGGIAGLLGTAQPGMLPPGDVIDQKPQP